MEVIKKENYAKTVTESETKKKERGISVRKTSLKVLILSNKSRRPYGVVVLLQTVDNLRNHGRYKRERISKCLYLFCFSIPFKMITKHW